MLEAVSRISAALCTAPEYAFRLFRVARGRIVTLGEHLRCLALPQSFGTSGLAAAIADGSGKSADVAPMG